MDGQIPGFETPVHRALTEPILMGGAPRSIAILNGTLAAALGIGLRLWLAGLLLWFVGHMAAVWAAKRDPDFVEVVRRHLRIPGGSIAAITLVLSVEPAPAQLVVFDPNNYAQNVLTAARVLQQINNQIVSLQNQAQMLINQAKNLATLPFSSLLQLEQSILRTQQLLAQAQRIAYDIGQIDRAFSTTYAPALSSLSDQALIANAQTRWQNAMAGLQDAMRTQATVVGNINTNHTQMSALVTSSQSATGALQASQAGNQLLALTAQQLADLTAVVAAHGRAQNLESAQHATAQDQSREQLRRFIAPGQGYQPTTVQMFH